MSSRSSSNSSSSFAHHRPKPKPIPPLLHHQHDHRLIHDHSASQVGRSDEEDQEPTGDRDPTSKPVVRFAAMGGSNHRHQREREPLLDSSRKPPYDRCSSHVSDELRDFRSWLRWMCVDQTAWWRAALSWAVFLAMGVAVPGVSHFVLAYNPKRRSYDAVVQASLTSVAVLSFLCLSGFVKRYGLRRFLFLDKLCDESEMVRLGYTVELNRSFKLLFLFVGPCFLAEAGYKVWWYCIGSGRIPFLGNPVASDVVAFSLELCSWLYRTSIYFLVCVLFRLICHLQILRLQDFAAVFQNQSDVATVLAEHLRIRRHLRVISHRFRLFIVTCLLLVSTSQLASLLFTTRPHADVTFFNTGELALCSVTLIAGFLICLRSAAKITHKAQAITSHAAKWHVCATIDSFDTEVSETPRLVPAVKCPGESSDDEVGDDDDDDTDLLQPHANTLSFQKRQAFVTYLENNKAGITVYGFMLDRAWLQMIFGVELPVVLWLLSKTIGIS